MNTESFSQNGYSVGQQIIDSKLIERCKNDLATLYKQPEYQAKSTTLLSLFDRMPDRFPAEVTRKDIPKNEFYTGTFPLSSRIILNNLFQTNLFGVLRLTA